MESKLRNIEKNYNNDCCYLCIIYGLFFDNKKLDQNVNDFANNTPTDTTPIELQKRYSRS